MHPALQGRAPSADFHDFDTLWIQISGTLCNLRCSHCFISCSPENDSLALMETAEVLCYLEEARELGVKEIYFTGGRALSTSRHPPDPGRDPGSLSSLCPDQRAADQPGSG